MTEKFLRRCEREIEGAQIGDAVFSDGLAVWCGTREIAHFHEATGALEIRVTKAVIRAQRDALRADARVKLRKNASDWIEFTMRTKRDADDAVALVRAAVEANASTAPLGPPPSGADLARRRRFH